MRLAATCRMEASTLDHSPPALPSFFGHVPPAATEPKHAVSRRKLAFWSSMLAVPAAATIGTLIGSRRTGILAGALAALGLGALRWQLARWFSETPAYETLGEVGDVELRRYPFRIEARADIEASDLEVALDRGFGRLVCYLYGANADRESLAVGTPILTTMSDGVYTTAFAMPPHRAMSTLPRPKDTRVDLREVAEKKVAVYQFRGRFTRDNIELQQRRFLRALVDAGLAAKGSVTLATYDSPATLPMLRRNELWIEIV